MKCIRLCVLVCATSLTLAAQGSFASHSHALIADPRAARADSRSQSPAIAPVVPTSTKRARGGKDRKSQGKTGPSADPLADASRTDTVHPSTGHRKRDRTGMAATQKGAARDDAERDARAQRLYRSSQFSAPIIIDAKACRRTGAHGESIYENC